MTSFVMLFDAKKGEFVKEARYGLPPKNALICAVEQHKGNYNFWTYPKDMDGIYESKVVKGRLMYDIDENFTMCSQKA